ncbi:GAF domain-containing sensor histidine kinase [Couchioplanes caeruleus]|uniref:GAF domain-containing sensor histidine kinase n=1 Tax=Couchioplanes caeruleus TaxID=56438 RepID=UPI0020BF6926|nr:GAF domain-containing sensor histidine kinase [Couchioplanes caeruleus]UQU61594.1 GAF domain-containing sensor histidine kinase [Couchioplanes caeruleus]
MSGCDREELRQVSEAVLAVTARLSVRDVLQTIVAAARRLLDARYAALGVPGPGDTFAEFLTDGISDEQWKAIGPMPHRHGLLGAMLLDPEPVRLADVRSHPRFGWWPAAHPVLADFLGMPIVHDGEILGTLFLANKQVPGGFTAADEELLRLLAGHAAIALTNARLYERNRELSVVAERHRIARELHDAVAQKLFSLRLTADAAAALVTRDAERARAELDTVRRLAAEAAEELRAIVEGLRPADLAGDGVGAALRKHVEVLDRAHRPAVRFAGGPVPRLTPEREEAVYRVGQEALHNALRHADASVVTVAVHAGERSVVLEVTDDGRGFDPGTPSRQYGLASMRERARAAGGRLRVRSAPGAGTTVRLEVPADA